MIDEEVIVIHVFGSNVVEGDCSVGAALFALEINHMKCRLGTHKNPNSRGKGARKVEI